MDKQCAGQASMLSQQTHACCGAGGQLANQGRLTQMRMMSAYLMQGRLTATGSGVAPHIEQKMEAVGQWQGSDPKKPKEASHSHQAGRRETEAD